MNIIKCILVVVAFVFGGDLLAQTNTKMNECKYLHDKDELFKHDPAIAKDLISFKSFIEKKKSSVNLKSAHKYVIPVVFHVFGTEFNDGTVVNQSIIEEALRKTNEDFQGLSDDWNDVDSEFMSVKKSLDISFELAKLDPSGNPTTGVTFNGLKSGFGSGSSADDEIRKYAWDNKKYMNVYIMRDLYSDGDFNNSGVAWFPSAYMTKQNTARVVYNGSYLGSNTSENFRSVLTHEFGHFLGLDHTFKGGCSYPNDSVDDTPPADRSSMGREDKNCEGKLTNWQNFMNYTSQYAMYTRGQVLRMIASLDHESRINLWSDDNLKATGLSGINDFGPNLQANVVSFSENKDNLGSIGNTIIIRAMAGAEFAQSSGILVEGADFKLTKIPSGLTAKVTYLSTSQIEIKLEGEALRHESFNDVSDISFEILDNAIVGSASALYNPVLSNIKINFISKYTSHKVFKSRWGVYSYISSVKFGTINNKSGKEVYTDYTNTHITNVSPGSSYTLDVVVNKGGATDSDTNMLRCWIDWNGNMFFDDNEEVFSEEYALSECSANGDYEISKLIKVPADAKRGGALVMRLLNHFKQGDEGKDPYGTVDSGEGEDYSLFVVSPVDKLELKFIVSESEVIPADDVLVTNISTSLKLDPIVEWNWTFTGAKPSTYSGPKPPVIRYTNAGVYDIQLNAKTKSGKDIYKVKKNAITCVLKYNTPTVNFGASAGISRVRFSDIDNTTKPASMFTDYSSRMTANVRQAERYNISISMNKQKSAPKDMERFQVWIDWNGDCIFSKSELSVSHSFIITDTDANGDYTYTVPVLVPLNSKVGKTRMRVMLHLVQKQEGDDADGKISSGEIEDYTVNITKGDKSISCDFYSPNLTVNAYEPVDFYNQSESLEKNRIVKWDWVFEGAGIASSSDENPKGVVFTSVGRKSVSLTVTSDNGEKSSFTKKNYVNVLYSSTKPVVSFLSYAFISNVKVNNYINNSSSASAYSKGYTSYYSTHKCKAKPGDNVSIIVTSGSGDTGVGEQVNVFAWLDLDGDGHFVSSELIASSKYTVEAKNKDHEVSLNYKLPLDVKKEKIALRIMVCFDESASVGEILKIESGEIEDYCLDLREHIVLSVSDNVVGSMDVVVFPNPVSDVLRVLSADIVLSLDLYDMSGRLVLSDVSGAKRLNVSSLELGLYFLKVRTASSVSVRKIIVK